MSGWQYIVCAAAACMAAACSPASRQADEEARACYEQGKALRETGEQTEAMRLFLRAAHSGTRDEALTGRVYSNMANMCRQANEHEQAYKVYRLSAEHFRKSGDSLAYAYALNNMAWEQAVMCHKDSASALTEEALRCPLSDAGYQKIREKVRETQAAACLFAKEYDSALYYSTPPASEYLLTLRAQAYAYLHEDDSATYYARLMLPKTTNPFYLDDIYYILTHHDPAADTDSLRALSSARADVQKAIEIRHGKLAQALQLLEQDMASEPSQGWIWLVLAGVLCAATCVFCYRKRRVRDAQETRRREQEQMRHTLHEAESIRQELSWNEYGAFSRRTDEVFNGLASRLQAAGLTEQDVRMCVLVLLGVSHKETAELLNCSPKSVGKLKDLTAHKLGVSGGQLRQKMEEICPI